MKKRLLKILSGILAALFVVGLLPPLQVSANPQGPVTGFQVEGIPRRFGNNFELDLLWRRPLVVDAPSHQLPYNHPTAGYNIMFRNATVNQAYWPVPHTVPANPATIPGAFEPVHRFPGLPGRPAMLPGMLYQFWIQAFHWHYDTTPIPPVRQPQVQSALAASEEVLFMTDIHIEGEGEGNQMTLRWSIPLFNGRHLFDAYRIHFVQGSNASPAAIRGGQSITVPIPLAELNRTNLHLSDNFRRVNVSGQIVEMYMFEWTSPSLAGLVPGRTYSVAIEPMLGGVTGDVLRDEPQTNRINIPERISLPSGFGHHRNVALTYTNNMFQSNVFIRPNLEFFPIGADRLLLRWTMFDQPPPGAHQLRIYRDDVIGGVVIPTLLGVLHADANGHFPINFWLLQRPYEPTDFRVEFYNVAGIRLTPRVYFFNRFYPGITPFTPLRPQIRSIEYEEAPLRLYVEWDAFLRRPFTAEEMRGPLINGLVHDPDIVYYIWITDDMSLFFDSSFIADPANRIADAWDIGRLGPLSADGTYTVPFGYFVTQVSPGNFVHTPIQDNRVFYVKIVARRTVDQMQASLPSYGSIFIPGPAFVRPPIVPAPPLRILAEGLEHIDIAWETGWTEVFDTNTLTWITQVEENGNIINVHSMTEVEARNRFPFMPVRTQVLRPGTQYQLIVVPYDRIADEIPDDDDDFYQFVERLNRGEFGAWSTFVPVPVDGTLTLTHRIAGLERNTTYAIFFRPFDTRGGVAWWPTFITGATGVDRPPLDIIPTVPFLTDIEAGDTWLSFGLRPFTDELDYEFIISEFSDITTAVPLNVENLRTDFVRANRTYRRFLTLDMLFPDTQYYIWARSRAPGTNVVSNWSNPVSMRTLPIRTPYPPRGLGLASPVDVHVINFHNNLDHRRIDHESMIVSWLPHTFWDDVYDERLPVPMTAADFGSQIMGNPLLLHAYLLRVAGLTANRAHYVRARTIFTVYRSGPGAIPNFRFDYIVQVATNPQFIDAITVHVMPDSITIVAGPNVRTAMSDWSQVFIFHTARDDGEFDGDVIPELFPLPDHDFEIIYCRQTQTLTYRFRSDGIDAQGHRDNLVDQRFISRLIQSRTFDYVLDMTHYRNNRGLPIRNRVVELPYSIITALNERQISFTLIAGSTTYSLMPGFTNTAQNTLFNAASRVRVYITDIMGPALPPGRIHTVQPQNIQVAVNNPHARTVLPLLGSQMRVSQSINRAMMMDYSIASHSMTPDDPQWQRVDARFDEAAGTLQFNTARPSDFAAIGTPVPVQFGDTPPAVRDALYFVNSQMAFDDMEWFVAEHPIDAWQINRIIWAIAQRHQNVAINADLTRAQMSSLTNSGMLVPGGATVTREAAMAALVRLFEIRTGSRITGYPTLQSSFFQDMGQTSPGLRTAMLRAEFLGFLDHSTGLANPQGYLTMGDAMLIFEIILRN